MRDQFFSAQMAQRILQLHQLNEQIVFGIKPRQSHRRLEVEAQPLLDADAFQLGTACGQVHEENQVKNDGRGENGVAAEEINFNLHGIAEPAEDVDVVPTLFVITAWRVIVNANFMGKMCRKGRDIDLVARCAQEPKASILPWS